MPFNVEPIDFARSLPASTAGVLSGPEVRLLAAHDWTRNFATWSVFLQFPPPSADIVIDDIGYWSWPHFVRWRQEFRERVAAYSLASVTTMNHRRPHRGRVVHCRERN
jgi:hypothetical protein